MASAPAPTAPPFDPINFEPVVHGPTWRTNEDGSWDLPEFTLGWHVVMWAADHVVNENGEPWKFTSEQLRFVLWLYAIDEAGRFRFRNVTLQRLKGHGKSPLAAVIAIVELVGPCRFGGWDEDGDLLAIPNPSAWIQLAAASSSQTKNVMLLIAQYLPKRTRQKYDIQVGAEKIRAINGTRLIEILPTAHRSQEGGRPSLVIADEPHQWVSGNGGHGLAAVLKRNMAKSKEGSARVLWLTNAFQPGEDSIGERNRKAYDAFVEAGGPAAPELAGIMYDSLEAPANAPLTPEIVPFVLEKIRGDAVWLDTKTIVEFIIDPSNELSTSRRFWYNQIVADEETLIPPAKWDPLSKGFENAYLQPGDEIVLGFDGGKTDDATALVAIRLSDRCAFLIYMWERDPVATGHQEVNALTVDQHVAYCMENYQVRAFFADTYLWESYIDKWSQEYGDQLGVRSEATKSAIGFNMMGHQEEIARGVQHLLSHIVDQTIHHNNDLRLTRHVFNTKRRTTRWGLSFTKEHRESKKKNDGFAALLVAFIAMSRYLENGKKPPEEHSGEAWFF